MRVHEQHGTHERNVRAICRRRRISISRAAREMGFPRPALLYGAFDRGPGAWGAKVRERIVGWIREHEPKGAGK